MEKEEPCLVTCATSASSWFSQRQVHCFASADNSPPLTHRDFTYPLTRAQGTDMLRWLLLVRSLGAPPYRRVPGSPRGSGTGVPGTLHLEELPLEGGDSEAGDTCSSWLSRMCVQCTSAWISKGSAGFTSCCSLELPASAPGSRGRGDEEGRDDGKEGRRK